MISPSCAGTRGTEKASAAGFNLLIAIAFLRRDRGHTEEMLLAFDLLIAIAYCAIPLELLYFFLRYPFPITAKQAFVGALFVAFITVCGGTHIIRAFDLEMAVPAITGERSPTDCP